MPGALTSPSPDVKGGSPTKGRSVSPASRIPVEVDSEIYKRAMAHLVEAASKFNRERDGSFLKEIDNREIDKELFRIQIRGGLNCRLSSEEMNLLMPHFDNNGFVNGCEFILLLYRLRFEFRSRLLTDKIAKEKQFMAKEKEWLSKRQAEIEEKSNKAKISFEYTPNDHRQAMEIVTEAAFRYDRAMPGTVQLEAFECEYLEPAIFKDTLRRVFNIHMTPSQLGAFLKESHFFQNEVINCASFLVFFLRLGFDERAKLTKRLRDEKIRINAERAERAAEEAAQLATKNSLKCSLSFHPEDKERALLKLREAAKYYDKAMPGAMSMQSFEVHSMPPHVFKEQLKRVFNLHVSARELGALMSIFDEQNTGSVHCGDFSKTFLAMGFAERDTEFKANLEKQREADRLRKEEEELKMMALAGKNQLQLAETYTQEDFEVAMHKLKEAAFRFDKSMPGSANLTAFDSLEMEPSIFKEQMRRAFNMKLSNPELAALVSFFDTKKSGKVPCREFLISFLKQGFDLRAKKAAEWRTMCRDAEEQMKREEEEKKLLADRKIELKVRAYTEEEFHSAQEKLTLAALKYHKDPNSNGGLDAFEAECLPPHVFKEQIKMCFNMKVNVGELAALMAIFDKHGKGIVRSKTFLNEFFRIGFEERSKIAAGWRDEQKAAEDRAAKEEEDRENEKLLRQQREVDFDFTEPDFDSGLTKFVHMCHGFEQRQLGPAGLSAFTCAYLTPSEFRETFKRTFGVKVGPRELGALVRYFEVPSVRGVVNCTAFLNLFVQLRVHCEGIKGKTAAAGPGGPKLEAQLLKEYHAELKEAYRSKLDRQSISEASAAKPWRLTHKLKKPTTSSGASKANYPQPKTPAEKLKLRIIVGKDTGRMDLSTKFRWREGEDDGIQTQQFTSAKGGGKLKEKQSKMLKLTHAHSSKEDAFADPAAIKTDFRLLAVPDEVLKMTRLTELWIDNHNMGWLPASLGELRLLEVLSVAGNNIESLPSEICLLVKLKRFYARKNALMALPERFTELKVLCEIDLSSNCFTIFPQALTLLPDLQNVNLQKNNISELPIEMRMMRSLSYLDLEGCPIKKAPAVLSKMSWTDVHGCLIPAAPTAAFRFKISQEDEEEIDQFLRHRAASRKIAHLRRKKGKGYKENATN